MPERYRVNSVVQVMLYSGESVCVTKLHKLANTRYTINLLEIQSAKE